MSDEAASNWFVDPKRIVASSFHSEKCVQQDRTVDAPNTRLCQVVMIVMLEF